MLKFTVLCFTFLSILFIINCNKDLNFCPDPWTEYSLRATNYNVCLEDCGALCSGHAFYDDDSQLVCYNVAKTTSMISSPSVIDPTCECGHRILRHWFGNQNAEMVRSACIPDVISEEPIVRGPEMFFQCKSRCESASAYLYRRSHLTYMVNCQREPRVVMKLKPTCAINKSEFPNQSVWRCKCTAPSRDTIKASGVKNELISPTPISLNVNSDASFQFFSAVDYNAVMEYCPETGNFLMLEGETLYQCHARCDVKCKGWGFRHKNSLICYHQEKTAERRMNFGKNEKVKCECGASLTNHHLYYDPQATNTWQSCNPEIFPDIPVSKNPEDPSCPCKMKCAEYRAYVQLKGQKKVILCKHFSDYVPMPQPLNGRCSFDGRVKCKCCLPAHRPPRELIEHDVILEDSIPYIRTNISTHAANRLEFPQGTNQYGATVYEGYSSRQTNYGYGMSSLSRTVSEQPTGSSRSNSFSVSHSSNSKRKMENMIGGKNSNTIKNVKRKGNFEDSASTPARRDELDAAKKTQNQLSESSTDEESKNDENVQCESNESEIPPKKQHRACLKNPTFVPAPPPIHPSIIAAERELREKQREKGKSGKRSTVEKSPPKPRGRAKKYTKPDILPTNITKSPRSKRSPKNVVGDVTRELRENPKPTSPAKNAEPIVTSSNLEHQNDPNSSIKRRERKKANEKPQQPAKSEGVTSKSKRGNKKSTANKETGTEINKETCAEINKETGTEIIKETSTGNNKKNGTEINKETEKGINAREGTANINSPDVITHIEASAPAPKPRKDKQKATDNPKPKRRAPSNPSGKLIRELTESEIARRACESSTSSDSQSNIPFQLPPVQVPPDQPSADQPNLPPPNKPKVKRAPRKNKTTDQPKVKRTPRKKKAPAVPPPKPPKPAIPSNAEVINLEKPDSDLEIFDADCQVVNRPKTRWFRERPKSSIPLLKPHIRTKSKNKQPIPPDQVINLVAESPPHPSRAQLRPENQRENRRSNAHSSSSHPKAGRQSSPQQAPQSSSDLEIFDAPPPPSRPHSEVKRQSSSYHASHSSSHLEISRTPQRPSTSQPVNEQSHTFSASASRSLQSPTHPTRSSPEPQSNPSSSSRTHLPPFDHSSKDNRRSNSPSNSFKTNSLDHLANIPDKDWLKLSLWGDSPSKGNQSD